MHDRFRHCGDPQEALREIGFELHFLAAALADIALPAGGDPDRPASARRVGALIIARCRRASLLPVPVTGRNWTLLLRLLHAHLQHSPLRTDRASDRRALERLCAHGLAIDVGGAWTLKPETAHALQRQLAAERRALAG